MISRHTAKVLSLKPFTRTMCYEFYNRILAELTSSAAIKESISWWQDDSEKLNNLWWVLNYYSDQLDPDRNLRAYIENHLDSLAQKRQHSVPVEQE